MQYQNEFDSIDYLVAYDNRVHDKQKYINLMPADESLRIQPDTSSYNAYRSKHNLALVGEQILMDGIPRFDYDYSAHNARIIQPKATGKLGQHYFDGGLKLTAEEMIQQELENCLFNVKKTMRRNQAKAKGFEILEKERDLTYVNNELYENVVFDDIYDKPNQNYRRVFYAPELNEQEVIENNVGEELMNDNDIEDFRHIKKVQEENIEIKLKKQSILSKLNEDIQKHIEEEEMLQRQREYRMQKQQKQGGIMKKKGASKTKKVLKFDDSIIDKNETSNDEDEFDGYGKQLENGKVKMSFKEFMNAQKGGGKRQTQSAQGLSSNKIQSQQDYVSDNDEVYDPTEMPKKIPRWKLQSDAIRASMKTSGGYTREENEMIVSALNKTDLVYCEYCKRKFKPGVADQHIPSCKEKFEEKQRQFQFQQKKKNSKSTSKM